MLKLNNRCFCYVTAAMFVSLRRTQTWRLHTKLSKFDNTLLRIAREWKTADTWFLARLLILQSSIVSQIHEFIYWMVTILFLITWLVRTMQNMSFHSQRWENIGTQAIDQDRWSFHLYLSKCHLLHNLHSLQKVIHRRNRETTWRPIPRTPSWLRERRPKRI